MPKFVPSQPTTCPHCRVAVRLESPSTVSSNSEFINTVTQFFKTHIHLAQCPNCLREIVSLDESKIDTASGNALPGEDFLLWPQFSARAPAPPQVPAHVAQDYFEASAVLELSPKASAALSRRCLQVVLREKAGATSKDLSAQIDEVLPSLPSTIAQNLDAIRAVGNFAAHQLKSQVTGAILDVESGEAEWNLEVLEALFDYYYVRPELEKAKRDQLNKKLQDAGKPPLKQ